MKTEDPSDRDSLVDLAAVKRIFLQLIDVHHFGDWRIFLDSGDPDEPDFTSYDPENTPPWIIHREDLETIGALHKQLVKAIGSAHIPMEDGEKSEGFLIIRKAQLLRKTNETRGICSGFAQGLFRKNSNDSWISGSGHRGRLFPLAAPQSTRVYACVTKR